MDDKTTYDTEPMDTSTSNDVMISVESTTEWQIHDILYDGTERYLKPLTFQDNVAKLANKVDWRKLIGGQSSQVDPELGDEVDESEEETRKNSVEPESVGPWEAVARNLHQALTEMNVLLDVIQIAQDRKYMVLDPVDSTGVDVTETNKLQLGTIFTFKKKIMAQGQKVFENIADRLLRARQSVLQTKEPDFQAELIELRQAWRLKKLGNTILGDLCYKNYGTNFRPNSTFEVKKSENVEGRTPAIEITLPKDLEQAVCLKITIESPSSQGTTPSTEVYFRGDRPAIRQGMKLWNQKLITAQRTLLCRDLYAQLCKEAIHLNEISCLVRGDCISFNLCHGYVLKIKLAPVEFENQEPYNVSPRDKRVFVLEHNLFQLFCGDLENITAPIVGRPTSGPLTSQNKRQRIAGPEALNVAVLQAENESDKLLLARLIEQTKHYTLILRTRDALAKFADDCNDPSVWIHWLSETTGTWSLARISIVTPFYESYNKTLIMLEIGVNSIVATTKEGEEIKFSSNVNDLINFLWITAKQHLITGLENLSRQSSLLPMYCSLTAVDDDGMITPSILILNQAGTKSICVKCPLESDPIVMIQNEKKKREEFLSDFLENDLWTNMRGSFRLVDYKNLVGRCFLQKMELLIACLS